TWTAVAAESRSPPDSISCAGCVVWTYRYTAWATTTVAWTHRYTLDYSGTLTAPANETLTVACPADAVDPGAPADILDACGNTLRSEERGVGQVRSPMRWEEAGVEKYRDTAAGDTSVESTVRRPVEASRALT